MQEDIRHQRSNVVMAPLIAGLIGAGLGILFAPSSGKETRARLRSNMQKAKRQTKVNMEAAQETLKEGVDRAKEYKARLKDTAKTEMGNVKQDARDFKQHFNERREAKTSPLASWEEEV